MADDFEAVDHGYILFCSDHFDNFRPERKGAPLPNRKRGSVSSASRAAENAGFALKYGMQLPMYDGNAECNSGARADKKKREEPSPFAQATFAAFEPFINVFDCGIEVLDSPIHLITKEDWRLFLHCGVLCDIEVKGTITHNGKSGRLAKLPFTTKPIKQADSDCWGQEQLERFVACPILNVKRIDEVAKMVEARIDEDQVARLLEHKERFIRSDKARAELAARLRELGWSGADIDILRGYTKLRDEQASSEGPVLITVPVLKKISATGKPPSKKPQRISAPKEAGHCDGNAFSRNPQDLPPFVRDFYQRHRRFPEVEDALIHLRDNGLFSGRWEDNEGRRAKRVGQILAVIEPDFDQKLLSNGESEPVDLRLGKFSWWVRQQFGSGISAKTFDLRTRFGVGEFDDVLTIMVDHRFAANTLTSTRK